MSSIKPFAAVHYNPEKIHDFSKVVCPPYDVISQEQQNEYHSLSPNNFIHIMLGKDKANDSKTNNKYTRAKSIFDSWIKNKILVQDDKPCVYFYKQEYKIQGEKHSRMGFISLMQLQDDHESKVYPHEKTHSNAVEDRLTLWRTLNSNLSCIFVCYSDKQKKVDKIFQKHVVAQAPLIDVVDHDKVRHKLWKLDDEDFIEEINKSIDGQQLFIADGHHRYEVSKQLRKLKMDRTTKFTGKEPFNYVMTYFTNIDSKDLQIFPMHRIIKNYPGNDAMLEEFFRIDKVKSKEELLIVLARAGRNEHAFGLYTREGIKLLRLKNKLLINEHVTEGSEEYKKLDATILKYFVFDKYGIESSEIIYTKDINEAFDMVNEHEADASFIMNPVKISQLKAVALNGERMPPKTTYFYPKVLSGLTVYKMD